MKRFGIDHYAGTSFRMSEHENGALVRFSDALEIIEALFQLICRLPCANPNPDFDCKCRNCKTRREATKIMEGVE